jgi:hypothetical protein
MEMIEEPVLRDGDRPFLRLRRRCGDPSVKKNKVLFGFCFVPGSIPDWSCVVQTFAKESMVGDTLGAAIVTDAKMESFAVLE